MDVVDDLIYYYKTEMEHDRQPFTELEPILYLGTGDNLKKWRLFTKSCDQFPISKKIRLNF
jgi:hypothetical protein